MKFLKTLGFAVAAALMVFVIAGTASATELTSPAGTKYSGEIAAGLKEKTEAILKSSFIGEVKCAASTVAGSITNSGGATETVKGSIATLTFTSCNGTVTVVSKGTFEVHGTGSGNGTLTSSGAQVTVELAGLHCIYSTSSTNLGVVTGGTTATFKAESAAIPRTGGRSGAFCGSSSTWTAEYVIKTPDTLLVDGSGGGGGKTSTTTATSLSGESKSGAEITVNEGSKAKDTATLSGTNAGKATGTVKYKVYADKECKELVTSAGEVSVSEGKVPASEEKTLEAGRVYYWQAEYSGDSSNEPSKSSCGGEVLTVKAATSLSTSLSGEAKSGEEITILEGSKAKDTATLSGTRSSSATGKVKFKVYKDKECKELASEAGEGSLSEAKATSEEKALEAGAVYYWRAEYAGDSLHQASTSTCGKEVLTVKGKTSLTTSLLGEGEEGEEITVAAGTSVVDTATLSGTGASTATGTIEFFVYADSGCKELVAEAGEWTVGEEGIPSSEEEELEEGTYYWQAEYSGDSLHGSSVSPCAEVLHVRAATSLTTSLAGEGNEGSELEVAEGAGVTDTATLSGKNASEATGTVKYSVYSDAGCTELVEEAGEVSVSGAAVPASEKLVLGPGAYYWQADYSGDAANDATTAVCGSEVEQVMPRVTTALSGEGSNAPNIVVLEGAGASDQATLHGAHAAEATGTVKYSVYADSECKELVEAAGEVSVKGAEAPSSSEVELPAGTYYWQAEYSGDELNPPASSDCGVELLDVVTATTLSTQLNGEAKEEIEVSEGATVVDYATVAGTHAATAEGTVLYNVYADSECKELAASAGEAEVSGGVAGPSGEVELPAGTYYWQAEYLGDYLNHRSTSVCGSEIEQVKASVTTELSAGEQAGNELEVQEGTAITDTATLHGAHASEATGSVKYLVYSDTKCEKLVTEAGKVTVEGASVPASKEVKLEPGVYFWRAEYSGDKKNPAATSSCGSEEVLVAGPESKYAALGDSFSSGEGILGMYYARTNQKGPPFAHENICHRSEKAWPALTAEALYNAGVVAEPTVIQQQPPSFIFRACSGATMGNVWSVAAGGQWDEPAGPINWFRTPAQAMWLLLPGGAFPPPLPIEVPNEKIKLVTLTIGGNDANFATVARACTSLLWADAEACQNVINAQGAAGLAAITAQLPGLLAHIHASAPKARIRQPFYPQLVDTAVPNRINVNRGLFIDNTQRFNGLTTADMIEAFTRQVNRTIEAAVKTARGNGVPVRIIPQTEAAFTAHRLGDLEPWVNGILLEPNFRATYHPTRCGHIALARRVMKALKIPAAKWPALC